MRHKSAPTRQLSEIDGILRTAGLTRALLAEAFGVTPQRIGQILNGGGVSYNLAEELRRYINGVAGKPVCSNDSFILQLRKEGKKRRRPPNTMGAGLRQ